MKFEIVSCPHLLLRILDGYMYAIVEHRNWTDVGVILSLKTLSRCGWTKIDYFILLKSSAWK